MKYNLKLDLNWIIIGYYIMTQLNSIFKIFSFNSTKPNSNLISPSYSARHKSNANYGNLVYCNTQNKRQLWKFSVWLSSIGIWFVSCRYMYTTLS